MFVETLFDIGSLTISAFEFYKNPSLWNAIGVTWDLLSVVIPGVPALSGATKAIKSSSKLQDALSWGDNVIKKAGIKPFIEMPTISGMQRHHIFEKRFADVLGVNMDNIFSIPLRYEDHQLMTQKMRDLIPYTGTGYWHLSKDYILETHVTAYNSLYSQTGDSLWEFLRDFASLKQITPNR